MAKFAAPRDIDDILTKAARPTEDMITASLFDVLAVPPGAVVLLQSPEVPQLVLPIYVGDREAMAIVRRAASERFVRPLTHDLLEKIMQRTNVSVIKVEVDALEDGTFKAYLYLFDESDATVIKIDARPSDSIVLATGSGAPIYVARELFEDAGEPLDQWQQMMEGGPDAASPPVPETPPPP